MSDESTAPTRGVPLSLGGRELFLRYSLGARKRLIAQIGGEEKLRTMTGDDIGTVILAGLSKSAPDITLEWIEEEVDLQNLEEVIGKVALAMGYKEKPKVLVMGEAQPAPTLQIES